LNVQGSGVVTRILGPFIVPIVLTAGLALAQNRTVAVEPDPLSVCIGKLEKVTVILRSETAALRERFAKKCPAVASSREVLKTGASSNEEALARAVQAEIRARLVAAGGKKTACGPLDIAFDGTTVRVEGVVSNREAMNRAADEIRALLKNITIDLRSIDSLGCRTPISGVNGSALLDDEGQIRRLTFDEARSLGAVFLPAEVCENVGPMIVARLPAGPSTHRFWVWSQERGDPVYCIESGRSWTLRDFQLHDGRGAAILKGP
jgi:hypothetical protein